jgi:hypothetical protein
MQHQFSAKKKSRNFQVFGKTFKSPSTNLRTGLLKLVEAASVPSFVPALYNL